MSADLARPYTGALLPETACLSPPSTAGGGGLLVKLRCREGRRLGTAAPVRPRLRSGAAVSLSAISFSACFLHVSKSQSGLNLSVLFSISVKRGRGSAFLGGVGLSGEPLGSPGTVGLAGKLGFGKVFLMKTLRSGDRLTDPSSSEPKTSLGLPRSRGPGLGDLSLGFGRSITSSGSSGASRFSAGLKGLSGKGVGTRGGTRRPIRG